MALTDAERLQMTLLAVMQHNVVGSGGGTPTKWVHIGSLEPLCEISHIIFPPAIAIIGGVTVL